ncbi:hypothetical protein BsWGS_07384 [Bradybaena similaris]
MANDIDELDINSFYIALQSKYLDLYERAQKNCYLLCIPQEGSFNPNGISTDFVETHILRPSPYFKGQFMTTHSSNVRTVTLSEDGQTFTTLLGFDIEVTVKILSEELAYNKDYQQYKILILEQPLDSKFKLKGPLLKEQREKKLHTHKISVRECTEFLQSFPEFKQSLENLDRSIKHFCSHYMVLADYLNDAVSRLRALSIDTLKDMQKKLKPPANTDMKLREVLAGAIESYMMNAVYQKVFVVIRQLFSKDDHLLLTKCHTLSRVRPEEIGVSKQFSCPLPTAVVELANLGSLTTPREKLTCLKWTVDNVTECITAYLQEKRQTQMSLDSFLSGDLHDACITSDDLIPILVTVIAKAKCCHLLSDLYYTEHFVWESSDRDRDDFGYCLVSFKAAAQYMMETDFSYLRESSLSTDREISIEELMAVTSVKDEVRTSPALTTTLEPQARLERQISRISDILEQTSREMGQQNVTKRRGQLQSIFPDRVRKSPQPETKSLNGENDQSNQLGDFLSALQDDVLDQQFGKQK